MVLEPQFRQLGQLSDSNAQDYGGHLCV